jgi:hypothetical protein
MKVSRTMVIAAGALAVTATTLLAGCGGKSSEVTAASTPAAPESAAAEPAAPEPAAAEPTAADVPTSVTDGLVKPPGVSDEDWTGTLTILAQMDDVFAGATPEEVAKVCDDFGPNNKETIAEQVASDAEQLAAKGAGGSVEEWTVVVARYYDNTRLVACSMVE